MQDPTKGGSTLSSDMTHRYIGHFGSPEPLAAGSKERRYRIQKCVVQITEKRPDGAYFPSDATPAMGFEQWVSMLLTYSSSSSYLSEVKFTGKVKVKCEQGERALKAAAKKRSTIFCSRVARKAGYIAAKTTAGYQNIIYSTFEKASPSTGTYSTHIREKFGLNIFIAGGTTIFRAIPPAMKSHRGRKKFGDGELRAPNLLMVAGVRRQSTDVSVYCKYTSAWPPTFAPSTGKPESLRKECLRSDLMNKSNVKTPSCGMSGGKGASATNSVLHIRGFELARLLDHGTTN
ncbi:hypothetical protein F5050DRAFT_1904158 [Lentinula boryana]|uniref:Uncharacterized protein n=1 Tax=Lentinula boryana TaxID=40481 RepID=A0ABQ8Q7D3_9AGAR|nr:hypothetical protein F5050DRAFT_1904158 [Lentinula boryana]